MIQIKMNYFLQDFFHLKHFAAQTYKQLCQEETKDSTWQQYKAKIRETTPVVQPAIFFFFFFKSVLC